MARSFAKLLVLLAVIQCFALACQANGLTRSLSGMFGGGGGNEEDKKIEQLADSYKWAEDSLIGDKKGKANKVSKLLRFLHQKAGDRVYQRREGTEEVHVEEVARKELEELSDDKVIESVCQKRTGQACKFAIKAALKTKPEERSLIAKALRHRPDHVDSLKLLYHKLFESAILKAELKGIDEKIDKGIDLLATKSPYGFMATKALNMATRA